MHLPAVCPECLSIQQRRAEIHVVGLRERQLRAEAERFPLAAAQLVGGKKAAGGHSFALRVECTAGHARDVPVDALAHEVLFELGSHALLDGYDREALLDYAAAFERFQHFCGRFLLAQADTRSGAIEGWSRTVARQAERMLGSYVALWVQHFGEEPLLLPQTQVELRNQCAHGGLLPDRVQVLDYGGRVLEAIVSATWKLQSDFDHNPVEYWGFLNNEMGEIVFPVGAPSFLRVNVLSERYAYTPDPSGPGNRAGQVAKVLDAGGYAAEMNAALKGVAERRKLFASTLEGLLAG